MGYLNTVLSAHYESLKVSLGLMKQLYKMLQTHVGMPQEIVLFEPILTKLILLRKICTKSN